MEIVKNAISEDIGILINKHDINVKNIDNYIVASHRLCFNILNEDALVINKNLPHRVKHFKNVHLLGHNKNVINILDDVVIIDLYPIYSHFMIDMIGKFLYLQKFNKNLKPFFVNNFKDSDPEHIKKIKNTFDEIINKLSEYTDIAGNINIYDNSNAYLFDNIFSLNGQPSIKDQSLFYINEPIYKKIRDIFLPKRKSLENKNIFISRLPGTARHKQIILDLENEFKKRNYEIVFFENMSFEEEVSCLYDAKNIVGIGGNGLSNLIFANLKANIMSIHYDYDYDNDEWRHIAENLNLNYLDFAIAKEDIDIYFNLFDQIDTFFLNKNQETK